MIYIYKPRSDGKPGARELFYTPYSRRPNRIRVHAPRWLHVRALTHELGSRVDWFADGAWVYWGKLDRRPGYCCWQYRVWPDRGHAANCTTHGHG
jgi:hypothetical protein